MTNGAERSLTGTCARGDIIDWAIRAFEVLHLPGHSRQHRVWEGSTRRCSQATPLRWSPLFDLPGSSIADYVRTLRRLLALDVAIVHAGTTELRKERLREIARTYLASGTQLTRFETGMGNDHGRAYA